MDQSSLETSVLDALHDAKLEENKSYEKSVTFRMDEQTLEKAQTILKRENVSLSGFVRHCFSALVEDYENPQA